MGQPERDRSNARSHVDDHGTEVALRSDCKRGFEGPLGRRSRDERTTRNVQLNPAESAPDGRRMRFDRNRRDDLTGLRMDASLLLGCELEPHKQQDVRFGRRHTLT